MLIKARYSVHVLTFQIQLIHKWEITFTTTL